jgi:hypothetical protein
MRPAVFELPGSVTVCLASVNICFASLLSHRFKD